MTFGQQGVAQNAGALAAIALSGVGPGINSAQLRLIEPTEVSGTGYQAPPSAPEMYGAGCAVTLFQLGPSIGVGLEEAYIVTAMSQNHREQSATGGSETTARLVLAVAALGLFIGLIGLVGGLIFPQSSIGLLLPVGAVIWLIAAQSAKVLASQGHRSV